MAYEFTDSVSVNYDYAKRAVNNTVFVHYSIENKSTENYDSFYLSLFEDPDIGCFSNDRVGCDTVRNMMFAYNGTTPDPDCQTETGYGNTKVAQGVIMLNNAMYSFGFFTNGLPLVVPIPAGEIVVLTGISCREYGLIALLLQVVALVMVAVYLPAMFSLATLTIQTNGRKKVYQISCPRATGGPPVAWGLLLLIRGK
jgi:hypothetical protein